MKKNWTMRVALLIVALTLITSCFVGGTFAKYVTGASYEDTARVAKFGVLLSIDGEASLPNTLPTTLLTKVNTPLKLKTKS